MHSSTLSARAALLLGFAAAVNAQGQPFRLCTENACSDCPQSVTSEGTGYPNCVIYDTETVTSSGNFGKDDAGNTNVWFDIAQPGETCATIIRSPADTTMPGCGYEIFSSYNAECRQLPLKETFMVQFCCGLGDCTAAGASKRSIRGASTGVIMTPGIIHHVNGTRKEPLKIGYPEVETKKVKTRTTVQSLERRDCTYTPDAGFEDYTRPGDQTFIIAAGVDGGADGADIAYTNEQSVSRTTSFSASVGDPFGIVSVTVGFDFTEEQSQSVTSTFHIPANQHGDLGWTPNLRCSTGTISCDGTDNHGEDCTAYITNAGVVDGTYAVVQH